MFCTCHFDVMPHTLTSVGLSLLWIITESMHDHRIYYWRDHRILVVRRAILQTSGVLTC